MQCRAHRVVATLLALLIVAATARAQERPSGSILLEMKPLSLQSRNGGPVVVDCTFRWTGQGVLRGDLEFSAVDGDYSSRLLGRFRIPDLVASEVPQSIRLMLPPLDVRGSLAQALLRSQFVTADHVFPLPEQVVRVPGPDKRVFTIAVPNGWGDVPSPGVSTLVYEGLEFERFDPSPARSTSNVVTVPNWLAPEDFPRDPLMLCTFDLVALVDEGLADLRPEQLEAVVRWVDAGGSAFVRPGDILEPRHVEFLNALSGLDSNPAGFRLDPGRKLVWPDGWESTAMRLHRKGLGRVVIAPRPTGETELLPRDAFDTPEWREAMWFVWKLRRELLAGVLEAGEWRGPAVLRGNGPPTVEVGPLHPQMLGVQPLQSGGWLLDRLIPESVQLVPLWIVGCILALFVLVVGPVDYFLLGLFRLRKLTWAVFPVVAVAFAWFTVWLSNHHMQTTEQNRSLVILDVGAGGRIVRSNELKLYFANTSRANVVEAQGELVSPLDHHRFRSVLDPRVTSRGLIFDVDAQMWTDGRGNFYSAEELRVEYGIAPVQGQRYREPQSIPGNRALVAPPEYAGRPPVNYTVSEWLPQWTPHLHRRFRIRPEGDFVEFAWDTIRPEDFDSPEGRHGVRELVAGVFGDQASIALIHHDKWHFLRDGSSAFNGLGTMSGAPSAAAFLFELSVRGSRGFDAESLRQVLNANPGVVPPGVHSTGLFSLVSQIAPTGGDNFEDLALLDPTDDRQWLLLVAVRDGNDWHLYRKLYVDE